MGLERLKHKRSCIEMVRPRVAHRLSGKARSLQREYRTRRNCQNFARAGTQLNPPNDPRRPENPLALKASSRTTGASRRGASMVEDYARDSQRGSMAIGALSRRGRLPFHPDAAKPGLRCLAQRRLPPRCRAGFGRRLTHCACLAARGPRRARCAWLHRPHAIVSPALGRKGKSVIMPAQHACLFDCS